MAEQTTTSQPTPQQAPEKPYNREEKLKELLEQDEKRSPWSDDFFGF